MKFNKTFFALILMLGINSHLYAESDKKTYSNDAVDILKIGSEYNYIEDSTPSSKKASTFEIEMSEKFGTYEDLKNSDDVSTGKVWLGTIVKKTKDDKCFAVTKYVAKDYKKTGNPEIKQAIDEIQCEELSLGKAYYSSTTPNYKKIGLFAGDKDIKDIDPISEEYQADGSLKKIVIYNYKNKQSKQCVLFMSSKSLVFDKNFNPEKRICYPYYGA